jgi:hypothetical protein
VSFALLFVVPTLARAGPPFVTDDPEPVDHYGFEVYLASQLSFDKDGWSGTCPHVEVNYGVVPNVQLHLIAPVTTNRPDDGTAHTGYGDTELGVKYRFIQETSRRPQVGIFPIVLVPTGDLHRGLGSGHVQALLPIWVQKSFGKWTTYGGGGYAINPGEGNKNWVLTGWLLQREVAKHLTLGAEVFHVTASEVGGRGETRFNVGAIVDLTEHHHLLFSAGRTLQGDYGAQAYVGYQLTFSSRPSS